MKKLITATMFITASTLAFAGLDCRSGVDHKHPACYGLYKSQHYHQHNHPVIIHRNNDWVGPAIVTVIGGAVIADVISRNRRETVVVQPQPTMQTQTCSVWTETQNSDGTITRTRTCSQ
jgi:hypothetical protein